MNEGMNELDTSGADQLTGFDTSVDSGLSVVDSGSEGPGQGGLSVQPEPPRIDPKDAARQAAEAHLGLGSRSPGQKELEAMIANGQTPALRQKYSFEDMQSAYEKKISDAKMAIEAKKGDVTPREAAAIQTYLRTPVKDTSDVILEKKFSSRFINSTVSDVMSRIQPADNMTRIAWPKPEEADSIIKASEEIVTKRKAAQNMLSDLAAERDKTSWVGDKGWDMAKQIIPFYPTYQASKVSPNTSIVSDFLTPGSARQARIEELHAMEPEDSIKQLKADVERLKGSSLLEAIKYVDDYMNFSTSDRNLGNIFGVVDIATAVPVGLLGRVAKAGKTATEVGAGAAAAADALNSTTGLKRMLREVVKTTAEETPHPVAVANATGDITKAAEVDYAKGIGRQREIREITDTLPTTFNPTAPFQISVNRSSELIRRLEDQAKLRAVKVTDALTETATLDRAPMQVREVGFQEAIDSIKRDFTSVNDAVIDVKPVRAEKILGENTAANVDKVVVYMGKPDATTFTSALNAEHWASEQYKLGQGAYEIEQLGPGSFVVRVEKVVDETSAKYREAQRIATQNQVPNNILANFTRVLSADFSLSEFQRQTRKQLTYGLQEIQARMKDIAAPIGQLSGKEAKVLERILEMDRTYKNDNGTYGRWHRTLKTLDQAYMDTANRLPTEKEINAYFSYVALNDYDYATRNLTIYRDKARQGIENARLEIVHPETGKGPVNLEVKRIEELPWSNSEDWSVYFHDPNTQFDPRNIKSRNKDLLATDIETLKSGSANGYKIYQVANPDAVPFQRMTGDRRVVNFIMTKDIETSPLDLKQIPYKAGGHFDYQNQWYVKQPIVDRVYADQPAVANSATNTVPNPDYEKWGKATSKLDGEISKLEKQLKGKPAEAKAAEAAPKAEKADNGLARFPATYAEAFNNEDTIAISNLDAVARKLPSSPENDKLKDQINKFYFRAINYKNHPLGGSELNAELGAVYESRYRKIRDEGESLQKKLADALDAAGTKSEPKAVKAATSTVDYAALEKQLEKLKADRKALGNPPDSTLTSTTTIGIPPAQKPVVSEHVYRGDQTIFNFSSQAEAQKFAERMDTARKLMKDGKTNELATYLAKNLPFEYGEFTSLFKPMKEKQMVNGVEKEIVHPPRLHPDDPIHVLGDRQRSSDVYGRELRDQYGETFKDTIRSSYNLWDSIDKKYAGQRDAPLWTVRENTESGRPIFKLDTAPMVDPLPMMSRAAANAMRNSMMGDYKISAVEQWFQQFGDLLTGVDKELLKTNPAMALYNGKINPLNGDFERASKANASRDAIINLIGTESELGQLTTWMKNKIANGLYERFGASAADRMVKSEILEKDPIKLIRSIAFHEKLGLFNPIQLFLQAQTAAHAMAIAGPVNGMHGLNAGTLMWMFRDHLDNPDLLNRVAKMSGALGYDKQMFKESYAEMRRSGIWNVEGEHAWKERLVDPTLVQGAAGNFLDKGTIFFKEGERIPRMVAWNAAFVEWKTANPGKAITNEARREILDRTNTMTVNMTRDANAAWQQGIMSLPTQFLSYNARLTEQLLGGRLTGMERARVMLMYSALYGVPTGTVGMAAGAVWPAYEDIRRKALENNMNPDQASNLVKGLADGIPALITKMATGQDYNIPERYAGGNTLFRDILYGDKATAEILFGASGTILAENIKSLYPIAGGIMSTFSNDPNTNYSATVEDIIAATQNISTANNALKMIYALNTGKWITKNDVKLADVNNFDAVFMAMTGTSTREISDMNLMTRSLKLTADGQKELEKEISKSFRRAHQALAEGDEKGYLNYMRRVNAYVVMGGWQDKDMATLFAKASKDNMDAVLKVKQDFVDKAPKSEYMKRWNMIYNKGKELN